MFGLTIFGHNTPFGYAPMDGIGPAPMPDDFWRWCPAPGLNRRTAIAVDMIAYGDGYIHRSTRGLNPIRPSWDLLVPYRSKIEVKAIDDFVKQYAVKGFWFLPPDLDDAVYVTCDEWSFSTNDKNRNGIIGTFSATFTRSFNPQPIS